MEQNYHWHKELTLIYNKKMRKLVIAATMLFAVQFASAQSVDFKKDVIEMVKISGSAANYTAFFEPIMEQISEDKRADFKKDIEALMPSIYEKTAEVMMKYYTHDDVKKMMEFYKSPIGQKIQESTPKILKDQMSDMQDLQLQIQGILMKYMQ